MSSLRNNWKLTVVEMVNY